jgi:carboxyl-terminal processing protease
MNRKMLWLVFALATTAYGASPDAPVPYPAELKPAQQQAEAAHLAAEVLARYHYKGMALNEAASGRIFDRYLKSLDPEKLFFIQADIDRMSGYRARLGDALLAEDLSAPFAMFNLYERRAAERFTHARKLLATGFDFKLDESYQYERNKAPWPQTQAENDDLWRKRVKNDWLRLRLAGKDDRSIADILDKRYETAIRQIGRVTSADAFQAYMNAYTMTIEPHTNYMGPRAAEDFDISMRLSLVGIGAVLAEIDGQATIREMVPGGPAILSGALNVGDRIVGVAQGERGTMTDVQGWRLDDAVALIRGAADSVVVLDVIPAEAGPDGRHRTVTLVRKTISMEAQAAKASVRSFTEGKVTRRVGVISLPSFYEDFVARQNGQRDYKSATRDVARLLEDLKRQKVDSVLIDLRNNGGGSLTESVELTGLFIDKGPVVQQRNARGEITVESDTDAGVAWDGPLGVLINRASASASEIFAAAIQDYGRGLVIGEPSFGKGTVQTMVNLDKMAESAKPQFGELKMTVAQFFRINGGTTQLRGVKPDIAFPEVADEESFGESSFDNALPWVQIKPAQYAPAGDLKAVLPELLRLHALRVKKDADFVALQEDIADAKRLRARNLVSLNEQARRKETQLREAMLAQREARGAAARTPASARNDVLKDDGLQSDERNLKAELLAEQALKSARDVYLDEAAHILGDQAAMPQGGPRLAARARAEGARLSN